jgi:hypothetical protein
LIALYVARSRASNFRGAISTIVAAGAIAITLFLLARAPLGVVGPAARLAPAFDDLSSEALKRSVKENLWDRNRYGPASMAMIARRPWFGVGVGSFQSLLPEFFFEAGGPVPPDNAQNWYRHQLAELGIVGSLPWIAWVLIFGRFALRRDPSATPHLWTARGILLAFAAISFVGMPGQEPAVAVTFWTMALWFAHIAGIPQREHLSRVSVASIAGVLIVYAAGTLQAAVTDLRVPLRAQRVGWPYSRGFSPPLPAQGATGGWTGQRAVAVVPASSRWMMLTVSVDHRALVSPDGQRPASHAPTRPSDVKVWCNGELVLDRQFTTTAPVSTYVQVSEPGRWMLIETWASRVVRPKEFGVPDERELGLLIDWTFVPQPPDSWTATRP